jgi:hypothetical protein
LYGDLLTGKYYRGALAYRHDPMLYGIHVWQAGWATDPAYVAALAGWISRLYPDYADTIPLAPYKVVPIRTGGGRRLQPGGDLVVKVFQGAGLEAFQRAVRPHFTKVHLRKPKASRDRSREHYVVAKGRLASD